MKTYTLKGRNGNADIDFTIEDLIPLKPSCHYDYDQLVKLINYRDYDADWQQPMGEEYQRLYNVLAHKAVDFFRIKGTEIIIMPGLYIYPTILAETEIKHFL